MYVKFYILNLLHLHLIFKLILNLNLYDDLSLNLHFFPLYKAFDEAFAEFQRLK